MQLRERLAGHAGHCGFLRRRLGLIARPRLSCPSPAPSIPSVRVSPGSPRVLYGPVPSPRVPGPLWGPNQRFVTARQRRPRSLRAWRLARVLPPRPQTGGKAGAPAAPSAAPGRNLAGTGGAAVTTVRFPPSRRGPRAQTCRCPTRDAPTAAATPPTWSARPPPLSPHLPRSARLRPPPPSGPDLGRRSPRPHRRGSAHLRELPTHLWCARVPGRASGPSSSSHLRGAPPPRPPGLPRSPGRCSPEPGSRPPSSPPAGAPGPAPRPPPRPRAPARPWLPIGARRAGGAGGSRGGGAGGAQWLLSTRPAPSPACSPWPTTTTPRTPRVPSESSWSTSPGRAKPSAC